MESACQLSSNCHLLVDGWRGGGGGVVSERGKKCKACGRDNMVKDRGRTLGVVCLDGLKSI